MWTMGIYQAGQPPVSGSWSPTEAALTLSAHLGLEPLSDNDRDQGFVNSFLVFFSSMYKCICFVSIFVLK